MRHGGMKLSRSTPHGSPSSTPGSSGPLASIHRWTRLSSARWEDVWMERLRFLGHEKIAFTTWPDSRALKIEAYCDERTARQLVKRFGGRATKLAEPIWTGDPARPRGPLSIRGKLKIFSDKPSWREWRKAGRKPDAILIPAGMAFGTGEHATTATCLRRLSDIAAGLRSRLHRPRPRNRRGHPRRRRKGARRQSRRSHRPRSCRCANR